MKKGATLPQTAILGWGSLLWEGGSEFEQWHDGWKNDGPSFKLEFSRVSAVRLGALTLVIDPKDGAATTVAWCLSKRKDPDDAVADLRCREGCAVRDIKRLTLPALAEGPAQPDEDPEIAAWGRARKLDVVVWTGLHSNFAKRVGKPFSVPEAISYLKGLPAPAKVRAAEYIWRAPEFVRTPLRTAVEQDVWFAQVR